MANIGRPLKFNSVDELEQKIKDYYQDCIDRSKPLTIAGLACYLDVDRHTIYNYENKSDEFFHTIKKAREYILADLEERLMTESKIGQIFIAKQYGYRDKTEVEATNTNLNLNQEVDLSRLKDEELEQFKLLLEKVAPDKE